MRFLWLFCLAVVGVAGEKAKFYNYQLIRLNPQNESHVEALRKLSYTNEYIYLTFPTKIGRPVDIVVPPHKRPEFGEFLRLQNLQPIVRMGNYQSLLDEEESVLKRRSKTMEWTSYHSLDEIYKWLDELDRKYPFVKPIVAGRTFEGREIRGIEITFGKSLTGVFIESGIHACEWIGPAGTSWMVNQILNSPEDSVFRKFNYVYVPVFNPDGYVYSWEKYRLWRKTRKPYPTDNKICYGVDLNRNWDFHWNEGGVAQDPCASNYPGPHAFSEPETKSLSQFISASIKTNKIDLYLAFHSYYQMILYPWGWSPKPAPLHELWKRIGEAAAVDLAAVHGTKFTVGDEYNTIWQITGDSGNWVYGKFNTTIQFTFEMRDTGDLGFVLPAKNIIPVGEEHLPALERILIEYEKLRRGNVSDGKLSDELK